MHTSALDQSGGIPGLPITGLAIGFLCGPKALCWAVPTWARMGKTWPLLWHQRCETAQSGGPWADTATPG